MPSCVSRARQFQNLRFPLDTVLAMREVKWTFDMRQADPEWGSLISFTSLHYHQPTGQLYCGLTSEANQLLIAFDPDEKQFTDLGFQDQDFCERYDTKIHRSFEPDGEDSILFATAALHEIETNLDAEGGRIFRFWPDSGEMQPLARPVRRDYIQTIAYDPRHQLVYGNCYPMGNSFIHSLKTDTTTYPDEPIDGHKIRCDCDGNLWGLSGTRHKPIPHVSAMDLRIMHEYFNQPYQTPLLYRYNPDDGYEYLDDGLPLVNGRCQQLANGLDIGDGGMYLTTSIGMLYRVDKQSGAIDEIAFLGAGRLEGIAYDPERGLLFLGGGQMYQTHVFVVDVETRQRITPMWPVADEQTGERCIIVHDLAVTQRDGAYLVYTGETDNPNRSGHLWESEIRL
jgi:hypothetical protein